MASTTRRSSRSLRFARPAFCLIAGVVVVASIGMTAVPASASARCRDSSAIRHAKATERHELSSDIDGYRDRIQSEQDSLTLDTDQLNNVLADSSSTRDDKDEARAAVAADKSIIAAFKLAVTNAGQDQQYLTHCGSTVLKKGERLALRHAYGLSIALDQAELTQENVIYGADRDRYQMYLGSDDPEDAHLYKSLMDSDLSAVHSLERDLAALRKALQHA